LRVRGEKMELWQTGECCDFLIDAKISENDVRKMRELHITGADLIAFDENALRDMGMTSVDAGRLVDAVLAKITYAAPAVCMCGVHNNLPLRMYCSLCNHPICVLCMETTHEGHPTVAAAFMAKHHAEILARDTFELDALSRCTVPEIASRAVDRLQDLRQRRAAARLEVELRFNVLSEKCLAMKEEYFALIDKYMLPRIHGNEQIVADAVFWLDNTASVLERARLAKDNAADVTRLIRNLPQDVDPDENGGVLCQIEEESRCLVSVPICIKVDSSIVWRGGVYSGGEKDVIRHLMCASTTAVAEYRVKDDVWKNFPPLHPRARDVCLCIVGTCLYAFSPGDEYREFAEARYADLGKPAGSNVIWRRSLNYSQQYHDNARCVLLKDMITVLIAGDERGESDVCSFYNTETERFRPAPSMRRNRMGHVAVLYKGRAVMVGGYFQDRPWSDLEQYDEDAMKWTTLCDMPAQKKAITGAVAIDEKIFVVGEGIIVYDGDRWTYLNEGRPLPYPIHSVYAWENDTIAMFTKTGELEQFDKSGQHMKRITKCPMSITDVVAVAF
jgi:hypothetical protein